MKRKILLSPLIIIVLIIIAGVGLAGAAILIGTTQQGETNSQSVNLQKGLVGWWDFNGNAKDKTLYANNGTVTGATLTTDRKGQTNKAYSFSGTTQYITVPYSATLAPTGTAMSVSAWFKTTDKTANSRIVSKTQTGGYHINLNDVLSTPTDLTFLINIASAYYSVSYPTASLNNNQWYHVVGTYDGSTVRMYLDSVSVGTPVSVSGNITYTVSNPFCIGSEATVTNCSSDAGFFPGSIDDVRIYNRALSATEITALYQEYDPGIKISDLQKGLVGNWDMNGNAKDKTLYANNGTVTGATLANDRKGQAQKAYGFNGNNSKIDVGAVHLNGQSAFSISAWINLSATGVAQSVITKEAVGTDYPEYGLSITATNNVRFWFATANTSGGWGTPTDSAASLSSGQWYHLIGTYDGSKIRMYINGALDSNSPISRTGTPYSNNDNATIGMALPTSGYLAGQIDDVRIYKRTLSAAEVTALYQEYDPGIQVSTLQKGLVGNWDMNGNAKDKTMYANNGTVTGATLTTDRKSQTNKAYLFNGTTASINLGNPVTSIPTNITLSAWIYRQADAAHRFAVVLDNGSGTYNSANPYIVLSKNSSDNITFRAGGNSNELLSGSGITYTPSSDGWYHVVGVKNGTSYSLYINGVLQGSPTVQANISGTLTKGYIGSGTGTIYFNSSIDDVRIYNRALTATEVTQLYESY